MRIRSRRFLLGLAVAAIVPVLAGLLQPWSAHWTGALAWSDPFCGNADNGDEITVFSGSLAWWTFSAAVLGAWAGGGVVQWWSRRAKHRGIDRERAAALVMLAGAAALGSLATLAAAHGLAGRLIARSGGNACISSSAFDGAIVGAAVAGGLTAVLMLCFREFAIAMGTACSLAVIVYAAIAAGRRFDTSVGGLAGPFDFAEVLAIVMPFHRAQSYAWAPFTATILICGLAAYLRTRSLARSAVATGAVLLMVSCAAVIARPM
jgi:hypothetical protein